MYTAILSSQNQITVPTGLLLSLGIKAKAKLLVDMRDGEIVVTALKKSLVDEVAGSLTTFIPKNRAGKDWEEILKETKILTAKKLSIYD